MIDRPDEILTIDKVVAYLQVGKRTVYQFAVGGKLPAFNLGDTWHLCHGELNQWITSRIGTSTKDDDEDAK